MPKEIDGRSSRQPYFKDAMGNKPSWFSSKGKFDHYSFDPSAEYTPKGTTFELPTNFGRKFENPFDLRNCRFFDPQSIQKTLQELEGKHQPGKPALIFIATGGTIGSRLEKEGSVPSLDVDFLLEYTGRQLRSELNHAALTFPAQMNSSQMMVDYVSDIAIAMSYLHTKMPKEIKRDFLGFVLSHGTDTMAPSATRLAMMLGPNLDFTVGVTGSQIGIDNKFNDVPDNVARCVSTMDVLHQQSRHGVFVYMGGAEGGAMHPAGAEKYSDTLMRGFRSPAIPLILDASDTTRHNTIIMPFRDKYSLERDVQQDDFQPTILRGPSIVKRVYARMDIDSKDQYEEIVTANPRVRALLLQTYGTFTMDRRQLDAVMNAAKEKDLIVLAASPFATGLTTTHTDIDSRYLVSKGVVPIAMMPDAAEVKMRIGQALYGNDRKRLVPFMTETDYIGEQPPEWYQHNRQTLPDGLRRLGRARETLYKRELAPCP